MKEENENYESWRERQERENDEFRKDQKLREKFKEIVLVKKEEWLKGITMKPSQFFENKKVKTIDEFNEELKEEWEKFKKQEGKK